MLAVQLNIMMTSSNGNIFHVTGNLCGEFTGHWWIPRTKASDAELLVFSLICAWINTWVNNGEAGDLRRHRAHYDITVMIVLGWGWLARTICNRNSVCWIMGYSFGLHVWVRIQPQEKATFLVEITSPVPEHNIQQICTYSMGVRMRC